MFAYNRIPWVPYHTYYVKIWIDLQNRPDHYNIFRILRQKDPPFARRVRKDSVLVFGVQVDIKARNHGFRHQRRTCAWSRTDDMNSFHILMALTGRFQNVEFRPDEFKYESFICNFS